MKKKILTLAALAAMSTGVMAAEDYSLTLGLGVAGQLSPYKGVDTVTSPIPVVDFQYGDFYIKSGDVRYSILSFGYDFYKRNNLKVSAYLNPAGGFDTDRSEMEDGYNNIDRRELQSEAGIKAIIDTGVEGIKVQTHLTYGEEGGHTGFSAFRPFRVTEKLAIIPRVNVTYFTGDYLDYYFGVSSSEVSRNSKIDKEYEADGGFAFGVDLAARYMIRENVSLGAFVGVEQLSNEIDDSPIVDESVVYRAGTTISYHF